MNDQQIKNLTYLSGFEIFWILLWEILFGIAINIVKLFKRFQNYWSERTAMKNRIHLNTSHISSHVKMFDIKTCMQHLTLAICLKMESTKVWITQKQESKEETVAPPLLYGLTYTYFFLIIEKEISDFQNV